MVNAGRFDLRWEGNDDSRRAVAPGVYFVRFASDERGTSYYEYRARVPRNSTPGPCSAPTVIAVT